MRNPTEFSAYRSDDGIHCSQAPAPLPLTDHNLAFSLALTLARRHSAATRNEMSEHKLCCSFLSSASSQLSDKSRRREFNPECKWKAIEVVCGSLYSRLRARLICQFRFA